MTPYDKAEAKIQRLPEPLVQEVNDYIDFLLLRQDNKRWELWNQFSESLELPEAGFSDYLSGLEDYESRLARGEIRW